MRGHPWHDDTFFVINDVLLHIFLTVLLFMFIILTSFVIMSPWGTFYCISSSQLVSQVVVFSYLQIHIFHFYKRCFVAYFSNFITFYVYNSDLICYYVSTTVVDIIVLLLLISWLLSQSFLLTCHNYFMHYRILNRPGTKIHHHETVLPI